ncbi:hypothetical protein ACTG15_17865 [Aeromonas sp. 164P]
MKGIIASGTTADCTQAAIVINDLGAAHRLANRDAQDNAELALASA